MSCLNSDLGVFVVSANRDHCWRMIPESVVAMNNIHHEG